MLASEVTFDKMRIVARNNPELGVPASYMQVEHGLDELEACWDGFVHTSDAYSREFTSRKQVCLEFAHALTEYIDCLGESISISLGSPLSSNS
jgi:hypothetical protein